jgi:hypothetical protein
MSNSKLKILFCLTVGLTLLFVPVLLEISPDGKAYAMGVLGKSGGKNKSSARRVAVSDPESNPGSNPGRGIGETNSSPTPVPEAATWLLVGAGAAVLAAYRKKFKKK